MSKFLKTFGYDSVKDFQKKNGLVADGIRGPKTKAKEKEIVVKLQAWLIFRGYSLACDGVLGKQTLRKLEKFLNFHNLGSVVDDEVWKALKPHLPDGYIAPHFRKTEFKCECGGKWCDGYNHKKVSLQLLGVLEMVRRKSGPVTITSGIRCQRYNDSLVGSIPNSVHRLGGAADIYVRNVSPKYLRDLAYKYGAQYSYYGTPNMGAACHINV